MATNTTKLGLIKPDFVDVVDVSDLNSNADDIDAAVGFTICTSATRPAAPWTGQSIFETDTLTPYVWDGSAWQVAGGGGSIEISATAPASPSSGDLWWDSDDGKLYIYYNDGTSSQWVDAAGPSVAVQSTAPTGYEGQLWLDDTDGSMYVYYTDPGGGSSSWIGAVSRSGGILQVVQGVFDTPFTLSGLSTSWQDITGFSASITPRSTSSKILAVVNAAVSRDDAGTIQRSNLVTLFRDSTNLSVPNPAGAKTADGFFTANQIRSERALQSGAIMFLDSPSTTSTITYSVKTWSNDGSGTFYVNRTENDVNWRGVSTITLMEVAG